MDKNLIKDIIISFLIIIAIILLIIVICYDKVSIGKVIPKIEEYKLSDDIKNEIDQESADNQTEIVTTYQIDSSDLKQYEKTKEYNKGKVNPFTQYSNSVTNTTGNNTNTGNNSSNSNSVSNSENSGTFLNTTGK